MSWAVTYGGAESGQPFCRSECRTVELAVYDPVLEPVMFRIATLIAVAALTFPVATVRAQDSDEEWLDDCRDDAWRDSRARHCEVRELGLKGAVRGGPLVAEPGMNGGVEIVGWAPDGPAHRRALGGYRARRRNDERARGSADSRGLQREGRLRDRERPDGRRVPAYSDDQRPRDRPHLHDVGVGWSAGPRCDDQRADVGAAPLARRGSGRGDHVVVLEHVGPARRFLGDLDHGARYVGGVDGAVAAQRTHEQWGDGTRHRDADSFGKARLLPLAHEERRPEDLDRLIRQPSHRALHL